MQVAHHQFRCSSQASEHDPAAAGSAGLCRPCRRAPLSSRRWKSRFSSPISFSGPPSTAVHCHTEAPPRGQRRLSSRSRTATHSLPRCSTTGSRWRVRVPDHPIQLPGRVQAVPCREIAMPPPGPVFWVEAPSHALSTARWLRCVHLRTAHPPVGGAFHDPGCWRPREWCKSPGTPTPA